MLSRADEFLVHQTPEPVRHAFTSDRRFFDRYFFTGHSCSEELFFLIGMGLYPNLGVIDAFASFSFEATQFTLRGSRELGTDRLHTSDVGPFSVEVLEPLQKLRCHCAATDGVEFDLEWTGAVAAFEEPPLFSRSLGRIMEQGTRYVQTGRWDGHITVDGRRYDVTADRWWGARDHSWGVRSMGLEREPKGIQQVYATAAHRTSLWIWSPMQFDDATIHFNVSEHASGEREISTVRRMAADGDGGVEVLGEAEHDLRFDPDTREFLGGSVSFRDSDGSRRRVELHPLRSTYLRAGTGYGGPDPWRHGTYMGVSWSDSVSFDVSDAELAARIGPAHVLCRMEMDTGQTGYGTFETQVFGAYPRYGFEA